MAQAVSSRLLITEAPVRFRASSCEICGVQSGTGTGICDVQVALVLVFVVYKWHWYWYLWCTSGTGTGICGVQVALVLVFVVYKVALVLVFVVYKVALVLVFLQVLRLSPLGILPTVFHIYLHFNPALIIMRSGSSVGDFARISTNIRRKCTYTLVSSYKVLKSVSWT